MSDYNSKSILRQFNFVIVCFITLGIGLFVLSYTVIDRLLTANASAYAKSTAEKFENEINFLSKRADTIFTALLFDSNIENLMLSPFSSNTPDYLSSLQTQFSSYSVMNRDIVDIALVSRDFAWSNYYDKVTLRNFSDSIKDTYGSICFGLRTSPLFSVNLREKGAYKLLFGHNIYGMKADSNYGKLLGATFLSLDLNKSTIILPDDSKVFTYFILLDNNGNSFSFNADLEIKKKILTESTLSSADAKEYLIYSSRLDKHGLTVITALDKGSLTAEVKSATFIIIAVALVSFIIIAILMRGILKNIAGLNHKLQEATVSLYESKLGKKQAELNFLRSQINPHFLYNSLESIAALSLEKSVPCIAEAIAALGKLFRYNIKGESIVPLEKELETIRSYLTICKIRFPEKLNIIYSLRENTLSIPVMKFILQPFVENVLKHSVEAGTKNITLYIGARLDESKLIINIYDDGKGIAPDTLAVLKRVVSEPLSFNDDMENKHIGLYNVAKRLFLYYGNDCRIELESELDNGTRVSISIPVEYMKVEENNVKSSIS